MRESKFVSGLLVGPPPDGVLTAPVSDHPLAKTQRLRVVEFHSRAKVFDRTYYPKFDFESTLYGRGTGANTDGSFAGGTSGLDLQRSNWAVGVDCNIFCTRYLLDPCEERHRARR